MKRDLHFPSLQKSCASREVGTFGKRRIRRYRLTERPTYSKTTENRKSRVKNANTLPGFTVFQTAENPLDSLGCWDIWDLRVCTLYSNSITNPRRTRRPRKDRLLNSCYLSWSRPWSQRPASMCTSHLRIQAFSLERRLTEPNMPPSARQAWTNYGPRVKRYWERVFKEPNMAVMWLPWDTGLSGLTFSMPVRRTIHTKCQYLSALRHLQR